MISKEKYQKSLEIVDSYRQQELEKHIKKQYVCICCKENKIDLFHYGINNDEILFKQESFCWDNGTLEKVTFGFGSRFDGESFYMAICDDCVSNLIEEKLIVDLKALKKEIQNEI